MPKVGGRPFPYSKKGMKAAEKAAKKTGKKMEMHPPKMPMKK